MRENNQRSLEGTFGCSIGKKWEIILISEVRAESQGVIRIGADDETTAAVVHSKTVASITVEVC